MEPRGQQYDQEKLLGLYERILKERNDAVAELAALRAKVAELEAGQVVMHDALDEARISLTAVANHSIQSGMAEDARKIVPVIRKALASCPAQARAVAEVLEIAMDEDERNCHEGGHYTVSREWLDKLVMATANLDAAKEGE